MALQLQNFDFDITYFPGSKNGNVDALSRLVDIDLSLPDEGLQHLVGGDVVQRPTY